MKTELEIFKAVNACETHEELAKLIDLLTSQDNEISGVTRTFNGRKMSEYCRNFKDITTPNLLTRKYGIRQQAMYIAYYEKQDYTIKITPYTIKGK